MSIKIKDLKWKVASSSIYNMDGEAVFEMKDITVPEGWSQSAINILAQKYFRKAGVPSMTSVKLEDNIPVLMCPSVPAESCEFGPETSAKQVFHRLAGSWTYWGLKQGHIDETMANAFYEKVYVMLALQKFAPNSPQWFNAGLNWAYGITGPAQGHYHNVLKSNDVAPSFDAFTHPQVSACFIQSISDRLVGPSSIMDTASKEALLFKFGSGSGTNFSNIRGSGEKLSGGGVSSGLMSFLKIGDVAAGAIKSGGTTRRAAKMVIVDDDHPDIEEFIEWKTKEEDKVASLSSGSILIDQHLKEIALAYGTESFASVVQDALYHNVPETLVERTILLLNQGIKPEHDVMELDWQSEAYRTVSGQNGNNTVRISDAFMNRVEQDMDWELTNRTDGGVSKTVNAADMLQKIAMSAWSSADPGIHYKDVIHKWHTCKADGEINASNPCSEYLFLDDTACNLASMNLVKYRDSDGNFAIKEYVEDCAIVQTILDISVGMAQYPTKEIAQGSINYRTTGIGVANLGGLLMRWGIPYDSEEGRYVGALVNSLMTASAYDTSAELAKKLGTFPRFEENKASMMDVIERHGIASTNAVDVLGNCIHIPNVTVKQMGKSFSIQADMWKDVYTKGMETGFRNAQVSVAAPTGTIGFVMDCDTTGIEPAFSLLAYKSLAGGGGMTIVNQCVEECLSSLGYSESDAKSIADRLKNGQTIQEVNDIATLKPGTIEALQCASEISIEGHLKMLSVCQPFLSGSLSKTINMPTETTVEEISNLIKRGRDLGLKALAVYRDNSKLSQPLNHTSKVRKTIENLEVKPEVITPVVGERVPLPNYRKGHTVKFKVNGMNIYLRTGEYEDGRLGEIFITMQKEGETLSAIMNSFAISTSLGLQYGVPLEEFVEANIRTKFEPSGMVQGHDNIKMCSSIMDAMFKHLAIYYLKRDELAHIKPLRFNTEKEFVVEKEVVPSSDIEDVYGHTCSSCGSSEMQRAGTCLFCKNCNESTGCS